MIRAILLIACLPALGPGPAGAAESPWKARHDKALAAFFEDMDQARWEATLSALAREIEGSLRAELAKESPDPAAVATESFWLAAVYLQQRRNREAAPLLLKALDLRSKKFGEDSIEAAEVLEKLSWIADDEKAEAVMLRVLQIREKVQGPEHRDVAATLRDLGMKSLSAKRYDAAEARYRRAVAIMERADPTHPDTVDALKDLAWMLALQERYDDSAAAWDRALAAAEKSPAPNEARVADVLEKLGFAMYLGKRHAEAEKAYLRALAIREKLHGPIHLQTLMPLARLTDIYLATGERSKWREMRRRVEEITEKRR